MEKALVMSDIHGKYPEFISLLQHMVGHYETDKLVLLGDYMDRGAYSLLVIEHIRQLKEQLGDKCITLLGNHDQMFLDLYNSSDDEEGDDIARNYLYNGGGETIASLLNTQEYNVIFPDFIKLRKQLKEDKVVKNVVDFLLELELYHEFGDVLFSHAGVPVYHGKNWERTTKEEFIWGRSCVRYPNNTGKVLVLGHTPVSLVREGDQDDTTAYPHDIWVNKEKTVIDIDGGCFHTGCLNGIVIDNKGRLHSRGQVYNKGNNTLSYREVLESGEVRYEK